MERKVYMFIGRSGCGKGTQAGLLINYLKEIDPGHTIFHLEAGERFRELVQGDTYTSKLAKKVNDEGGLQPAFLSIYIWSDLLVQKLKEDEHLILDGVPRREEEAIALKKALLYYGYKEAHVIHLDVSEDWAKERLTHRVRGDDDRMEDIQNKMDWYESKVIPTIDILKKSNDLFVYHQINGEQTIEEVWSSTKERLFK